MHSWSTSLVWISLHFAAIQRVTNKTGYLPLKWVNFPIHDWVYSCHVWVLSEQEVLEPPLSVPDPSIWSRTVGDHSKWGVSHQAVRPVRLWNVLNGSKSYLGLQFGLFSLLEQLLVSQAPTCRPLDIPHLNLFFVGEAEAMVWNWAEVGEK